jgi:multicomponent Na+:H+ antiporter subunit G
MIWIAAIFLFFVVFAALLSSFGILLAKDTFDRLHFLGPVTIMGSLAVFLAVFAYEGFTVITGKVAVTALILIATGPVITHAIARAGIIRGDARRLRDEKWEISE